GLAAQIVAGSVVARGFEVVEGELSALCSNRPTRKWELVAAILESDLDRVLSFDPGEIVRKLPAIVGQEPKVTPPIVSDRVVGNGALKVELGWSSGVVQDPALVRTAQLLRPACAR